MINNRLAYIPVPVIGFLESVGYFYVECAPLDSLVEVGEICMIECFMDWEIQLEPHLAVAHGPTGHYWMPSQQAPADIEMIKRIIRVGNEVFLERGLEGGS